MRPKFGLHISHLTSTMSRVSRGPSPNASLVSPISHMLSVSSFCSFKVWSIADSSSTWLCATILSTVISPYHLMISFHFPITPHLAVTPSNYLSPSRELILGNIFSRPVSSKFGTLSLLTWSTPPPLTASENKLVNLILQMLLFSHRFHCK